MKKHNGFRKSRQHYEIKRTSRKYKLRKARIKKLRKLGLNIRTNAYQNSFPPIKLRAPRNLSFINNTDDLLNYLSRGKKYLDFGTPVYLDMSKVTSLTPDSIPIILSHIRDPKFTSHTRVSGCAPDDINLNELFTKSGFYSFVISKSKYKNRDTDFMHKESNFKVKPEIAGRVTDFVERGHELTEDESEAIYNILIELMSNTHHHGSLNLYGTTKWWLYVYLDSKSMNTSICFIDTGVGIFKSMVVRKYLRNLGRKVNLVRNIDFVSDLLSGKIGSRIDADNDIRGKGIPAIVDYSSMKIFSKFLFISNDVKVDLKNDSSIALKANFTGTFFYIEIGAN